MLATSTTPAVCTMLPVPGFRVRVPSVPPPRSPARAMPLAPPVRVMPPSVVLVSATDGQHAGPSGQVDGADLAPAVVVVALNVAAVFELMKIAPSGLFVATEVAIDVVVAEIVLAVATTGADAVPMLPDLALRISVPVPVLISVLDSTLIAPAREVSFGVPVAAALMVTVPPEPTVMLPMVMPPTTKLAADWLKALSVTAVGELFVVMIGFDTDICSDCELAPSRLALMSTVPEKPAPPIGPLMLAKSSPMIEMEPEPVVTPGETICRSFEVAAPPQIWTLPAPVADAVKPVSPLPHSVR